MTAASWRVIGLFGSALPPMPFRTPAWFSFSMASEYQASAFISENGLVPFSVYFIMLLIIVANSALVTSSFGRNAPPDP
ncbi:hypothetical protein D3C84_1269870 [compost metagenome]